MFRKYLNHRRQVLRAFWKDKRQVYALVFFFVFLLTLKFWSNHATEERRAIRSAQRQADAEYVVSEVERRKAERHTDTPEVTTTSDADPLTAHTTQDDVTYPPPVETFENVELITSGPYKGMTVEAANAAARQHLAESKAAATRWHEWEQKGIALSKRMVELSKKRNPLTEASLTNGDAYLRNMLDYYAQLSDEQIEHTWQEVLALRPEDKAKVDRFFTDLVNHKRGSSSKRPEQIAQDARDILRIREAIRVAKREWEVEWQLLLQEMRDHRAKKPPKSILPKNLTGR